MNRDKLHPVDLRKMRFTFFEWVWGIFALIRFWNKRFRSPYHLPIRKALILMRLRGERLAALDELPKRKRVPYLSWQYGKWNLCWVNPDPYDSSHRLLAVRK
jgi:hypothetical protein